MIRRYEGGLGMYLRDGKGHLHLLLCVMGLYFGVGVCLRWNHGLDLVGIGAW